MPVLLVNLSKVRRAVLATLLAAAFMACGASESAVVADPEPGPEPVIPADAPSQVSPLADADYLLSTSHEWDRDHTAPHDAPLNYVPVASPREYRLSFSEQQNKVSITHPEWEQAAVGARLSQTDGVCVYRLSEGLFAGGELFVRKVDTGFEAQLDVLGSGVPLISSEKGLLRTAP